MRQRNITDRTLPSERRRHSAVSKSAYGYYTNTDSFPIVRRSGRNPEAADKAYHGEHYDD